jgi:hypothetical protein
MADASPTTTPSTTTPATPTVAENGYIYGIDGMLDQICGALARQGRSEWLPVLQRDTDLQARVGAGIGRELAKPLWILTFVAIGYVGYKIWRGQTRSSARTNPRGGRVSRRSRRRAASLGA